MRVRSLQLFSVVVALLVASAAQADPTYQYVFNQSSYTVSPGGTVSVGVSLQELNPTSYINSSADGLFSEGVTVTWDNSLTTASNLVVNPGFGLPQSGSGINAGNATSSAVTNFTLTPQAPPVFATQSSAGVWTIPFITLTFTAGNTPGVTHLGATLFSTDGDDIVGGDLATVFGGPDGVYPIANGAAMITVTPEPSTLVLSCIAALGFFGLRLRRKAA